MSGTCGPSASSEMNQRPTVGRQVVRVGVDRLFDRFSLLAIDPTHHPAGEVALTGFEFRGPQALWVRT